MRWDGTPATSYCVSGIIPLCFYYSLLFNVLDFGTCFIVLWRRRKWGSPLVNAAKLRHDLANHEDF